MSLRHRIQKKEQFFREVIQAWETSETRTEAETKMAAIQGFGDSLASDSARQNMMYYVRYLTTKGVKLQYLPAEPLPTVNWDELEHFRAAKDFTPTFIGDNPNLNQFV